MTPQNTLVDLDDPQRVSIHEGGKAIGFFCRSYPASIDAGVIKQLKIASERYGGKNVRLCLHPSPQADFHTMIILEKKENYYRPHMHLQKGECFHIVEGCLGIVAFDNRGDITNACHLHPNGTFLYKIEAKQYHAILPLSDTIIYHESKPGPFLGEADSFFPEWSPHPDDMAAVTQYQQNLAKLFDAWVHRDGKQPK